MSLRSFIFLGLLAFGFLRWHAASRQLPPPGIAVGTEPSFQMLSYGQSGWPVGETGCTATPYAAYQIRARVLGVKRYRDSAADVAPVDLVLGWGRMSDPAAYGPLDITPTARSYTCRLDQGGAPRGEIDQRSGAYHLVPADENVAAALQEINLDDVATLEGHLVEVSSPEDPRKLAPLTRGGGRVAACHMLRVTRVVVEPRKTL